jgi:CheY-like chemotaxis protein
MYKNILLIDDDADDCEVFIAALAVVSQSINCTAMSSATDALNDLLSKDILPDLIFLDLNMPVMNGLQFLTEIKKYPFLTKIPVIVSSTSSHQTAIKTLKRLGIHDFITKPDKFSLLVEILRPLLT